ncbi:MAG: hypothetical protein KAU14_07745 [Thermoplasmata archaeon]|nr:hypothetical protein [Thermoplasmata archaeon]
MGKIEKLNKGIGKLEDRIVMLEEELENAKQDLSDKIITKAEYTTLKQRHHLGIRDLRTAIGRKEKARLMIEKKLREKAEKKRKKAEEK